MQAMSTGKQAGQTTRSTGAAPMPTEAATSQLPCLMIVMQAMPTGKQAGQSTSNIGVASASTEAASSASLTTVMLDSATGMKVGQRPRRSGAASTTAKAAWWQLLPVAANSGAIPTSDLSTTPSTSSTEKVIFGL